MANVDAGRPLHASTASIADHDLRGDVGAMFHSLRVPCFVHSAPLPCFSSMFDTLIATILLNMNSQ